MSNPFIQRASAGFASGDPADQGLSADQLTRLIHRVKKIKRRHDLTIVKNGQLIVDTAFGADPQKTHAVFSLTKTLSALCVGIACDRGALNLDDPIAKFIQLPRGMNSKATVRHVLGQTAQSDPPGSGFKYNSGKVVDTLGAVLSSALGERSAEFARRELLEPLGMINTHWPELAGGHFRSGFGVRSNSSDLARVAELIRRQGRFGEQALVSKHFIDQLGSAAYPEANGNYGLLSWLNQAQSPGQHWIRPFSRGEGVMLKGAPANLIIGTGILGQFMLVIPDHEMVVTSLGRTYRLETLHTLQRFWDAISDVL